MLVVQSQCHSVCCSWPIYQARPLTPAPLLRACRMWWLLVLEARQYLPFMSMELRMDDEPEKVDPGLPLEGDNVRWRPNDMHEQVGQAAGTRQG